MGQVNTSFAWAVCTWLDQVSGKRYCVDLNEAQFSIVSSTFDAPPAGTIDSILEPLQAPVMTITITAPVRLVKKCMTHQQCIDTTQTMLNGRRP